MTQQRRRTAKQASIKRSWILERAGALFWEKGYHSTTMRDIAVVCECKPANIYNYFESKEDILYEVIRDITEQTVSSIKHLEADETTNPKDQLKSLIKNHFKFLVGMKRSSVLISDTGLKELTSEHRKAVIKSRDKYDNIMRKVIRRGIDSGVFSIRDEQIITFFISSVIMRSSIWFSPRGRLSADQVSDDMFDFVYRGIKTETKQERA